MVHIIGHRGGRNLWPENSIHGFRKLAELPVEGVEFDVHLTDAGEMLVIHDATLDRTTERFGIVSALARGENRDVRLKGCEKDTIPTLEEVLDVFADSSIELHVELKANSEGIPYRGLAAAAAAMLDRYGLAERSVLTSFLPEVLKEIRRTAPQMRTLSSFDANSAHQYGLTKGLEHMLKVSDVVAVQKEVLYPHWDTITAIVPRERLGVWVPNEESELAYWLDKPIHQLTTDRPDLALALRGA